jgi:ribulose-phosphate 3-epimerase
MKDHFLIAPSMLSCDFSKIDQEIKAIDDAGADMIHWDVMDGHFVPNLTFGAPVIAKARKSSNTFFDVHLMIEKPENLLDDFIKAGSDSITIHIESTEKVDACFAKMDAAGVKKGITLRPRTDLEAIEPYLSVVDMVLVMTVEPGFGGQSFMEAQIDKINELDRLRSEKGYKYQIEVDGGVSDSTAPLVSRADVLVAGSYIFKNDYKEAIGVLRNAKKS